MATNFDLAPPPAALAGGGTAVPMDISTIDAHFTFDAAAQAAHGIASLAFVVGPTAGRPVFDLRQTVTEVVLDGLALPLTAVPFVDLGGGPGAEVRVLDAVLASGTDHTLAVGYDVGPPASPPGGGYPPHLVWSGPASAACRGTPVSPTSHPLATSNHGSRPISSGTSTPSPGRSPSRGRRWPIP